MVKISITNARVEDSGYGLSVNGKSLEDIITTALGVKKYGDTSFRANACDVTVIIDPKESTFVAEREDGKVYQSVDELEEAIENEHKEETTEDDTEE